MRPLDEKIGAACAVRSHFVALFVAPDIGRGWQSLFVCLFAGCYRWLD